MILMPSKLFDLEIIQKIQNHEINCYNSSLNPCSSQVRSLLRRIFENILKFIEEM